ncbi:hypothetical protein [Streptosporangium roseum]|uniref:WxL domain-containing protein n=1 Tax=Streptosporangium roseum (strain ATCC 12428 / DSM 43021 / JCM 3005 / KCTC 9067 / NCIMB 10171 / NRRL 2505 / NI 9100) TaxID=479432 RepID=D2B773_STRRD|nr:hypothetical protein [Streptosporangium roseum]ACZ89598.1 conserved hypothetical protein [Streptosporangium roseum DSM 43021]
MRKRSMTLTSAGAGVLMFLLAAPAVAAPTDDTPITFEVSAGSLDVSAPAGPVDLGNAPPGGEITGQLGPVSVSDTRGGATSDWTASVYATDFTVAALTIPFSALEYWSGAGTAPSGGGTFTPGQLTEDDRVTLTGTAGTAVTAFSHSGGTGGSTVTWNPTLVISIPLTAQTGTYNGTVTHQVA